MTQVANGRPYRLRVLRRTTCSKHRDDGLLPELPEPDLWANQKNECVRLERLLATRFVRTRCWYLAAAVLIGSGRKSRLGECGEEDHALEGEPVDGDARSEELALVDEIFMLGRKPWRIDLLTGSTA